MNIYYHLTFVKHFKTRIASSAILKKKFEQRLNLLRSQRDNPTLHNHRLTGLLKGYCAISITGDIRLIYKPVSENTIQLYDIGSHNQVYR